ncbi:FRG domain-containing protein [Hyphomicrobium sp. B1]|uniref:FRG domain-containing protein n=1 Tax=Hyphomicrobium sp. B1 TaxID=3075651 RepID=UPI003C2E4B9B
MPSEQQAGSGRRVDWHSIESLSSLDAAIEDVNRRFDGARPWWRGHANQSWELIPRVFRVELPAAAPISYNERALLSHFRDRAPTRFNGCPQADDVMGWLFLGQHYGLPTRLLDWTISPLTALYFAVSQGHDHEDGHLYALSPLRLNVATSGVETERFSLGEPVVAQFALDAIGDTRKVFHHPLPAAVAISTREIDVRMLVQQSVFTLHSKATPLIDFNRGDPGPILKRYLIPSAAKANLRNRLAHLGLREASLFPDLGHLADELRKAEFHTTGV